MIFKKDGISRPEDLSLLALFIKNRGKDEEELRQRICPSLSDWERLFETARREGVLYPFYLSMPENIRNRFKEFFYAYQAQGVYGLEAIRKILEALDRLQVRTLLLKGWSVDSAIYRDGFYRPRADVDIVVRQEDWPAVSRAFAPLGYRPFAPGKKHPTPESLQSCLYVSQDNISTSIHLHRHIVNNVYLLVGGFPDIPLEAVWKQTTTFGSYGSIFSFSAEMQLVYLCEHALKHDYYGLVLFYEIDRWIRCHENINWDKVKTLAGIHGFTAFVHTSLYFALRLFATPVPQKLMKQLEPGRRTIGEKMFIRDILNGRRKRHWAYSVYLAQQEGFLRKISFIFRTLFPPQFSFKDSLKRRMGRA